MTCTITSSLRVALVAGTGVTFDAPVVNLISTDDVYSPENPAETLTDVLNAFSSTTLLGSATINAKTLGNNLIFTAAIGLNYVVTSVIFVLTGISGSGAVPVLNVGITATDYNDFINGGALFTAITAVGQILQINSFTTTGYVYMAPGDALNVRITTAATYTTYGMKVFVFGYSFA